MARASDRIVPSSASLRPLVGLFFFFPLTAKRLWAAMV